MHKEGGAIGMEVVGYAASSTDEALARATVLYGRELRSGGLPVSSPESGSPIFVLCFQHPLRQDVDDRFLSSGFEDHVVARCDAGQLFNLRCRNFKSCRRCLPYVRSIFLHFEYIQGFEHRLGSFPGLLYIFLHGSVKVPSE